MSNHMGVDYNLSIKYYLCLKIIIMTQTMHIADFKAKFSEVVKLLDKGVTIKVIKGKAGEVVGFFSKNETNK